MSDIDPVGDFIPDLDVPSTNGTSGDGGFSFGDVTITDMPSYAEDLPPLPEDDKPFGDVTQPIGDGTCVVCGAPTFRPPGTTKSGARRRVPKYCDLHSSNATVPPTRSSLKGVESQLQRIQEELADDIRLLATLAGPLLPVTGVYLFEAADPFTIAILKLAKNNTRIVRVLHRAAQVAPIYTAAQSLAGVAYAVQVDTGKADPHTTISKRLNVERAYEMVYPDQAQPEQTA